MFVYPSKLYTDCSTKFALVEVKFDATNEHNAEHIRYDMNKNTLSHEHYIFLSLSLSLSIHVFEYS